MWTTPLDEEIMFLVNLVVPSLRKLTFGAWFSQRGEEGRVHLCKSFPPSSSSYESLIAIPNSTLLLSGLIVFLCSVIIESKLL